MNGANLPPRNYFTLSLPSLPPSDDNGKPPDRTRWLPPEQDRQNLLTGALELKIEVLSALHVGCGSYDLIQGRMARRMVTCKGQPIVPGTSLKGSCRQLHEVLTQSPGPWDKKRKHLSRTGALFGTLGRQGRLSFDDACLDVPVRLVTVRCSIAYSPRVALGRRFYGPQPPAAVQARRGPAETQQVKDRVQALPPETRLKTCLRFEQITCCELGEVLTCLGLACPELTQGSEQKIVQRFSPKLGGGKYDPLGWVRFEPLAYQCWTGFGAKDLEWQKERGAVQQFCAAALAAAEAKWPPQVIEVLQTLQRKMQVPRAERGHGGGR